MARLHTGAVILLGGWLLMLPPGERLPNGNMKAATSYPVRKWEQHSAHDTARDCESQHTQLYDIWKKEAAEVKDIALYARCVPAEHIYPPADNPPVETE